jgi:quercetin dioxygenase-like cupin family protein
MQYVFSTTQTRRYAFPTHTNELVLDRAQARTSEVFLVVLEPGQAPPLHQHDDTEQIFYVLEGQGVLTTGNDGQTHQVNVGDVVRIPPSTPHSIRAQGDHRLCYVAVDCFINGRPADEPTWDSHVEVVCRQQGWDYNDIAPR